MTSDELALLRAVCESPKDDTPRLVLCDWLEERAVVRHCWRCEGRGGRYGDLGMDKANQTVCRYCHGRKEISDGRRERAEFIRVQCELSQTPELIAVEQECTERDWHAIRPRHPKYTFELTNPRERIGVMRFTAMNPQRDALRLRERESWSIENAVAWFGTLAVDSFGSLSIDRPRSEEWESGLLIARGFVESVTTTAADWLAHADAVYWHPGQTCQVCSGSGWLSAAADAESDGRCFKCDGAGTRPFPATAQPIERVRLTTRPIVEIDSSGGGSTVLARITGRDWPWEEVCDDEDAAVVCLKGEWPDIAFELPEPPASGTHR